MTDERDWCVHPGAILAEWLEEHDVAPAEFAVLAKLEPKAVEGVLEGRRRITTITACKIAAATGTDAEFWVNGERHFREGLAAGKKWTR